MFIQATMKFLVVVSVFVGLMVTVCAVNDTQFNDLKAFVEVSTYYLCYTIVTVSGLDLRLRGIIVVRKH